MGEILIVEDEAVLARTIVTFLKRQGYSACYVQNAAEAKKSFLELSPKLSIVDYKLAYDDGFELLAWMRVSRPDSHVVMMTGHGDIDLAVRAMKAGARDFLSKPVPLKMFADLARDLMLNETTDSDVRGSDRVVGRSAISQNIRQSISKLARFSVDSTPPNVLIVGANGVGKLLAAQAMHESTLTERHPLLTVDCTLDAADTKKRLEAAFADARSGTLILRHIDKLTLEDQATLLRLLTDKEGESDQPWLLSTSAERLLGDVRLSDFRTDLLYRLQIGWLEIPALSERNSDILPIAEYTARKIALKYDLSEPTFTPQARIKLLEYEWPGNVSELVNCIERAVLNALNNVIDESDLKMTQDQNLSPSAIPKLTQVESNMLEQALVASNGNVSKAARLLGISRDTLRYRMQKLGLSRR